MSHRLIQLFRTRQYAKLASTVMMAPLNSEVDKLNEEILEMFDEDERTRI